MIKLYPYTTMEAIICDVTNPYISIMGTNIKYPIIVLTDPIAKFTTNTDGFAMALKKYAKIGSKLLTTKNNAKMSK